MMQKIKFVFFGSDHIARSALEAMSRHGLVPSDSGNVAILVSYGKILTKETIDSFPFGILNIHPSLLPALRGPSPIKSAILDNLEKTGVSIMKLDEQVDHGPILIQEEISLSPRFATEEELRKALFDKGAELLARVLPDYLSDKLIPKPQDHGKATYTHKFNQNDAYLDFATWGSEPQVIEILDRKVRALNEEPGTYSIIPTIRGQKRVKILKAHIENNIFIPDIVVPEGKKRMTWQSFLRGNPVVNS
ncbi:MAG TPA: formyltransferase family protein [Candidatus Paceibacterota bacterium]